MSNIFTINPIKVNIISIKNTIKQTLVFIGIVPDNVKKELEKIEKNQKKISSNNKILDKFYGKSWQNKLGMRNLYIQGGDEFSFDSDETDDIIDEKIDEVITEISETEIKTPECQVELNDKLKKLKEPIVIDDSIEDNLEFKESNILINKETTSSSENIITMDDLLVTDTHEKITQITKTENNLRVRFIFSDPFMSIYPEDNIMEFKKKLYVILNIPIFRQHVWFVYQGRTIPLSYSIFNNNSLLYINIQKLLNNYNKTNKIDLIENIPICTTYYQIKNNIKIISNDTFTIMRDNFTNYGITEYNLLDLNEFIKPSYNALQKVVADRYQMELIYYSFIVIYWPMITIEVFTEYMKSEHNIKKIYPKLEQPIDQLRHIYKLEKKIIDTKNDLIYNIDNKQTVKKIRGDITNSITNSIIHVFKYQQSKDTVIYIRNLFDKFPLNDNIISCKCKLLHNNKKIILNKTFKKHRIIKSNIELDSIVFNIKLHHNTHRIMSLIFYKNGNYLIKASWFEEEQYDFDDIIKITRNIVHPIIDKINSFGSYVLSDKKTIPVITKTNYKFIEIGMSMFYKKAFSDKQFNILRNIMADYKNAGIVYEKNVEQQMMEYYFRKGMYQFNSDILDRFIILNNQ